MEKAEIIELKKIYSEAIYRHFFPEWRLKKNIRCFHHDDSNPSLSIFFQNGEYRFHCHACNISGDCLDIIGAMENISKMGEKIMRLKEIVGISELKLKIVKTYNYLDTEGNLIFQVVRFEPKDFRQRRPDPANPGKWIWNLNGVSLVPYNLPEFMKSPYVFLVEGEKDCESLKALSFVASCNPMGAGKWRQEYNEYFKGKHTFILPDNDETGRKHALQVAQNIKGVAKSIKIINLPNLPEKGDVSDCIQARKAAGKSEDQIKNELREIIQATQEWTEGEADVMETDGKITDKGLMPVCDFPFDAFPGEFQRIITKLSDALHIDPEIIASLMLAITSGALGNSIRISPKLNYEVPPFIWLIIIAPSGYGKSPAIKCLIKQVKNLQAKEDIKYRQKIEEYEEALKKAKLEKEAILPVKPRSKNYFVSDCTVEALRNVFDNDGRGIIIHQDEISGLVLGLDQYKGKGNDRQHYLELFNADSWKIDRKTETKFIANTGAAIIGGIQPRTLPKIFNADSFDDGLLPRFLLLHSDGMPQRFSRQSISVTDLDYWNNLLDVCYSIRVVIDDLGFVKAKVLILNDNALNLYEAFYNEFALKMPFLSERAKVFMPKLTAYYCLKFAGLLHCIKTLPYFDGTIAEDTMRDAIRFARYFAGQAVKSLSLYEQQSGVFTEYQRRLMNVLHSLQTEVTGGKLPLLRIVHKFNDDLPEELKHTPHKIHSLLKNLDLTTEKGAQNLSYLLWENGKIQRIFSKLNVTKVTNVTKNDNPEAEKVTKVTKVTFDSDIEFIDVEVE